MRRMQLPRVLNRSARLLSLTCLLSALALQAPVAWAEGTPGATPQPQTPADVVKGMQPPAPNPQLGGRTQRAEARDKANENVRKAEQERQQASNDAARNPNDASKQTKDLEAQQKLDQAITDAAKLNDDVRTANQSYQDAYKAAEKAANDPNANISDVGTKIRDLDQAKKNYETKLEEEKAKNARVNAPNWNRQRFAEQMERQRQATQQQGTPGTPQTQPGGATPGTGAGNIGQTQTPPTAAQVPSINIIQDVAGGGEGYNTSGSKIGWSRGFGLDDWSLRAEYRYTDTKDEVPTGAAKQAAVEYVKVCSLYGAGFYYIPGTDNCVKIGGWVRADPGSSASYRADLGNGVSFQIQTDIRQNQYIGLRSREPLRLPLIGAEKNTETGFQDGPLRCAPSGSSCIIPVTPAQGPTYGFPDFVGNLSMDAAWGNAPAGGVARFQVRYVDYQYGGSVADITGQSAHTPVEVPQGFQANAYDFSIGGNTIRRWGFRCTHDRPLVQLSKLLQMAYSRIEDDPGRAKEPALDPRPVSASQLSEKLPQARLDLRPPSTRMRDRR